MPIAYFDSSAFVKLLVDENGSEQAALLWDACDAAVSSRLAYVEVRAALAAAGRAHRMSGSDEGTAEQVWEQFWAAVRQVDLTDAVAELAGRLAGQHALRGADAVHLASALAVTGDVIFAVWDQRLRTGAAAAGLRCFPSP